MPSTMAWTARALLATTLLVPGTMATAPGYVTSAVAPLETAASSASFLRADLRRRQRGGNDDDEDEDDDERTASPRPTGPSSSSERSTRTTTVSSASAASSATPSTTTTETPSALPSPFDYSLRPYIAASDGTSNCPAFLHNLISSEDYKRCYPISMLIDTSQSWFEATRNLVSVVRVLDSACDADVDFCTEYFNGVAEDLLLDENCGAQYRNNVKIVQQAHDGLVAYELIYKATCLQDPKASQYCYATAVTGGTNASNVYAYYLPLNFTFPATANPTCSWCLKEMMGIFHAASADRDQLVAETYEGAAKHLNTACGPEYVNATLPEPLDESLAYLSAPSWPLTLGLLLGGAMLQWL